MTLRQQDGFEQRLKPGKMATNDRKPLVRSGTLHAAAASLVGVS